MKTFKQLSFIIFSFGLLLFVCGCEREWGNPFDDKSAIDPESWAPQNLQIEDMTITEKKLTWSFSETMSIEGFKIDRKIGDDPWQVGYQVFPKTARTFNDTIRLNPTINYHYRLYAFAGLNVSAKIDTTFPANLPSPENLSITANSATSVTLNWSYSLTGHEGFKIERKVDNGSWEMLANNLNVDQRSFNDAGINLNSYTYHYRVFAYLAEYNSAKPEQSITFIFNCGTNFTDARDGNQYQTVQIGNQCWMKENLKWLPNVRSSANGSNVSPHYYVYGYQGTSVSAAKATTNYQTYGVLYNWPAASIACPAGWHLPTDNEWTILIDYLGGSSVAAGKMKTTGTTYWNSPNTGATNSSGFSGLPGGLRDSNGSFSTLGNVGHWWSSTEYLSTLAWYRYLAYNGTNVTRNDIHRELGFSVRCVRD